MEHTISETAVIHGYRGSTAEEYAKKYGRTFVSIHAVTGDVDDNGSVDISDATLVLTYYAKQAAGINTDDFKDGQSKAADINADGTVDISDATDILTIYAKNAAGL